MITPKIAVDFVANISKKLKANKIVMSFPKT
jgi:hypothetical protein